MKVQKSKKSYSEAAQDELELLKDLRKHERDESWLSFVSEFNAANPYMQIREDQNFVINIVDNFTHFGIHGKH